jgi:hypothetical protein
VALKLTWWERILAKTLQQVLGRPRDRRTFARRATLLSAALAFVVGGLLFWVDDVYQPFVMIPALAIGSLGLGVALTRSYLRQRNEP